MDPSVLRSLFSCTTGRRYHRGALGDIKTHPIASSSRVPFFTHETCRFRASLRKTAYCFPPHGFSSSAYCILRDSSFNKCEQLPVTRPPRFVPPQCASSRVEFCFEAVWHMMSGARSIISPCTSAATTLALDAITLASLCIFAGSPAVSVRFCFSPRNVLMSQVGGAIEGSMRSAKRTASISMSNNMYLSSPRTRGSEKVTRTR